MSVAVPLLCRDGYVCIDGCDCGCVFKRMCLRHACVSERSGLRQLGVTITDDKDQLQEWVEAQVLPVLSLSLSLFLSLCLCLCLCLSLGLCLGLSVSLSVSLSLCVSVSLSFCLSLSLSLSL